MKIAPDFVQEKNFKTIHWRKKTEENDATDVKDVENFTEDFTEDITEDITNKVGDNVSVIGGVKALLVVIENNPGTNVLTMEKNSKVAQRTIERWMQLFREENKISTSI